MEREPSRNKEPRSFVSLLALGVIIPGFLFIFNCFQSFGHPECQADGDCGSDHRCTGQGLCLFELDECGGCFTHDRRICESGQSDEACGSGGVDCVTCDVATPHCVRGTCQSCLDECELFGELRCSEDGNAVETCGESDDDVCWEWGLTQRCASRQCQDGVCLEVPVDPIRCQNPPGGENQTLCVDARNYILCERVDGLLQWSESEECRQPGVYCFGGRCSLEAFCDSDGVGGYCDVQLNDGSDICPSGIRTSEPIRSSEVEDVTGDSYADIITISNLDPLTGDAYHNEGWVEVFDLIAEQCSSPISATRRGERIDALVIGDLDGVSPPEIVIGVSTFEDTGEGDPTDEPGGAAIMAFSADGVMPGSELEMRDWLIETDCFAGVELLDVNASGIHAFGAGGIGSLHLALDGTIVSVEGPDGCRARQR